jgi:hypothetical protein
LKQKNSFPVTQSIISKFNMAATRRQGRNSSSESSGGVSSSEDDIPSTTLARSSMSKTGELTLKDDEDTIVFQAPLPDDYGKKFHFLFSKRIFICYCRRTR